MEKLELFAKGCLGTCWHGKYHYLEPWAGCGHDCPYCYARFRSPVTEKLAALGAAFREPAPLYPEKELLRRIKETADSGEVNILKLCRYTDFFTPKFVANGLALKVLKVLVASKVKRLIVTTKGVPDKAILRLIAAHPEKFSYNAAVRPLNEVVFEKDLAPLADRLDAAAAAAGAGALTTVHLDPFVAGFDDREDCLRPLLAMLKERGLGRAMFSYLLLNDRMAKAVAKVLPRKVFAALKARYETGKARQYLPGQEESVYWALKPEEKRASVERTAGLLTELDFKFVLCSLKNTPGLDTTKFKAAKLCDGKFYA